MVYNIFLSFSDAIVFLGFIPEEKEAQDWCEVYNALPDKPGKAFYEAAGELKIDPALVEVAP